MRRELLLTGILLAVGFSESCSSKVEEAPVDPTGEEVIALERSALDRWITGNPQGYLDLYAPDVTYFDPFREKRVDGLQAMRALVAPLKDVKLPFTDPRYEMIDPKTERYGDLVLLTFNLVNYGKPPGQSETVLSRWNATEVYGRVGGNWRILHSHWSFVKPDVKQPAF